jgi:hypothetical protein
MKKKFVQYWLILFLATSFVACNFLKKKEKQNFTTIKFERRISSIDELIKIYNANYSKQSCQHDSLTDENGVLNKFYLNEFSIENTSDDSIKIDGQLLGKALPWIKPKAFNSKTKKWSVVKQNKPLHGCDAFEDKVISKSSKLNFYWLDISSELKDSMMFRYYFKTSQFKDSLMWHDVYYTFKNDSFIIVRQTENEK